MSPKVSPARSSPALPIPPDKSAHLGALKPGHKPWSLHAPHVGPGASGPGTRVLSQPAHLEVCGRAEGRAGRMEITCGLKPVQLIEVIPRGFTCQSQRARGPAERSMAEVPALAGAGSVASGFPAVFAGTPLYSTPLTSVRPLSSPPLPIRVG